MNPYARPCWHGPRTDKGMAEAGFCVCKADAEKLLRLHQEVDVLRRYGNKDCTAMADAALEEKETTGKFPFED